MGWLWGDTTSGGEKNNGNNDPTRQLESRLRDYLERESPNKYTPAPPPRLPPRASSPERVEQQCSTTEPGQGSAADDKPAAPPESLFPDGRYAHLWKTYIPQEMTDSEGETPQEKVITHYNNRRKLIFRAALENCAEEQIMLFNCFKHGDFVDKAKARMTMCRLQNSRFARCYTVQGKILSALGYGAAREIEPAREEQIQMHADSLYHQMLDYEARVEEAKKAGLEPPPAKSLFNPDYQPPSHSQQESNQAAELEIPGGEELPPGHKFSKPAKNLTPHEREVEVRELRARVEQAETYFTELESTLKEQYDAKLKRRENFSKWFGPTIGKWLA